MFLPVVVDYFYQKAIGTGGGCVPAIIGPQNTELFEAEKERATKNKRRAVDEAGAF